MKSIGIALKIQGLAVVSLLVTVVAVIYLLQSSKQAIQSYEALLGSSVQQAADARELQVDFKKQVQYWKDTLLRGSRPDQLAANREAFEQQDSVVKHKVADLLTQTGNPQAHTLLVQFDSAHSQLDADYASALSVFVRSRGKNFAAADAMVKGKDRPPTDLLDQLVAQLQQETKAQMLTQAQSASSREVSLATAVFTVLGVVFLLSAFVMRSIARPLRETADVFHEITESNDLTRRLDADSGDEAGRLAHGLNQFLERFHGLIASVAEGASRLATASEQISATTAQQAKGSEAQKDQTHQVATAMQQMSSTVLQVSENASRAAEASRNAAETARHGGKIVDETLEKMQAISRSVAETAKKVEELGSRSDQIGEIIGVIDDIADQTNLLALNAAIEAARAGEQGRGFAVVADEVRKLAERTVKATKEITQMIKSIQAETKIAVAAMKTGTAQVEQGVQSTTAAGGALEQIIRVSDQVGDMITHIATASTQQASATEQVNGSVVQIARFTQEAAVGAQQSAKAVQELSNLALDLQNVVGKFKVRANGQTRTRQYAPRTHARLIRPVEPVPSAEPREELVAS